MRVVICDEDALMQDVIESVVTSAGHELAGVAATTVDGVGLVEAGRPDAVIVDLSLGYNTDFDVIESAIAVGARAIVFSRHADVELAARYAVPPAVVAKPDLAALADAPDRLDRVDGRGVVERDRRRRPTRAASGPRPTGVGDAQAFFEAINDAQPGDALLSIEVPAGAEAVAADIARLLRDTDRLMAFPTAVRLYLPAGGDVGVTSVLGRIDAAGARPDACRATSVVVGDGETGADAFERLKHRGDAC
jgi:chemotaxis response regulator CheB